MTPLEAVLWASHMAAVFILAAVGFVIVMAAVVLLVERVADARTRWMEDRP